MRYDEDKFSVLGERRLYSLKIEKIIHDHYQKFSEGEILIAKCILDHKGEIRDLNINQLAEKALSSKSSVLRLVQKLGFSGYTEFKNYMKWEDILSKKPDEYEDFGKVVLQNVEKTINGINKHDVIKICEVIDRSGNIYLSGTGFLQQNLAAEMQRIFLGLGKNMQIIPLDIHTDLFQFVTEKIAEKDLLIIFSSSGNNPALEEALSIPLLKKVKIFSITASENNWLANHSTYSIPIYSERHSYSTSNSSYLLLCPDDDL